MASTKTGDAPQFTLHPYIPADKPGHYDEQVQALIDAGDGIAITIQIPAEKDDDKREKSVAKHKRWFQESAKKFGRTSRLVDEADQEDGSVHLDFILRDLIKRTRKSAGETAETGETAEANSDTPVEDAAA